VVEKKYCGSLKKIKSRNIRRENGISETNNETK